ncbi:hypothetical protein GTY65_01025 [Streptomyces sp. SID8379]|uniref:DUF6417 family protein n=1 Tax=unclassified Streptomyces TaxID=2593676 RepID=UPI000365ACC8|nr:MULTISPECIES: DUF6417 family protein [unclassified Streptomyces]MYW62668.1 hypothetical protein [Streptomyces sp. SID8379]
MGRSEGHFALLRRVADAQREPDGWATEGPGLDERTAAPLVGLGLARSASTEERTELSARAGHPVPWAVRLTADGWDVLLYAQVRATPSAVDEPPEPGLQKVALRRSDLDVLKRFVALGERLRDGPAHGLGTAVETARFSAAANRWVVHVTGEQMRSMARAFFLERLGGSAAPANRFARVYGVLYP